MMRLDLDMFDAMQAIDVLALHLPNKLILPDALHFAQEAINSPKVHVRAAACTVIVDVAEGCSDALRKKLLPVLQVRLSSERLDLCLALKPRKILVCLSASVLLSYLALFPHCQSRLSSSQQIDVQALRLL